MPEYTKEQFLELYRKLPEELKEAFGAEETMNTLESISDEYKFSDDQTSKMVELVGEVLIGLLPLDEFQEIFEKELRLKPEVTKKIVFKIYRFVFYPVRESLSALYQMEVTPPGISEKQEAPEEEKPKGKDIYREPID